MSILQICEYPECVNIIILVEKIYYKLIINFYVFVFTVSRPKLNGGIQKKVKKFVFL